MSLAKSPQVIFEGNWSFSKLVTYEACALRFKLKFIDKLPGPPPKPDNPLERGNRIHKAIEQYIKGETEAFVSEAKQGAAFNTAFTHLRTLYACDMATSEQDWYFDSDWNVYDIGKPYLKMTDAEKAKVWLWVKLDWNVTDEDQGLVSPGDAKSGKSQYKAIEHIQQVQLYSVAAALRFEWAEKIVPELHYVDEGWVRGDMQYTREQALMYLKRFDDRAQRIYADRFFRANPNVQTCRYCEYGPRNGTGVCPVGV